MAVRIKIYFVALLLATLCGQTVRAMDRPASRTQQSLSNPEKQARLKKFMEVCKASGIQCDEQKIREGHLELYSKLRSLSSDFHQRVWSSLSQLTWLVSLNLGDNQLKTLPPEIGSLVNLKDLFCDHNSLETLPPEIGNLVNLKKLTLGDTTLQTLPPEIGKLVDLELFFLGYNNLQTLPPEIGKLINLKELSISNNQLQTLPAEIGKLINLTFLDITNNQLQTLPAEIGNLINLMVLYLSNNELQTLPAEIGNLIYISNIDLTSCPFLLHQGDSPTTWGRQELTARLGDRVSLDDPNATVMLANTTLEQVYAALDAQPMRINREWLQKAALPDIKAPTLSGEEIVALFNTIMTQLNTTEESKSGYVSYEVLMNDYGNDHRHAGMANDKKINTYFMPRVRGFIKTLYGLPLTPGETTGWQMYPAQVPQMKQALSFILTTISTAPDIDTRAALMMQLANALLHCPTGQSEGLNTILYSLSEGQLKAEGADQRITQVVAVRKNAAFQNAILLKTADNPQNVHFISHYRDQLKSTLGLTIALSGYREQIGTFGQDPFAGNPNNVLSVFYQLVTPARIMDWVLSIVKTPADIMVEKHRDELEKLKSTLAPSPLQGVDSLIKVLENLKAQKKCLDEPNKIHPDLKEEINKVKKEDRLQWRQTKISNLERQINRLEPMIRSRMPKPAVPSAELIEYLKSQKLLPEGTQVTYDQVRAAILALNDIIKKIQQFRPLSTAQISQYLVENKIVNINTPNWWQGYFTADPDYEINALPAPKAIETILIHMGALKLKGK